MAASCLADTGAILAYVDARDPWHGACRDAMPQLRIPLLTTTAVLTEVFHFASTRRMDRSIVWTFLKSAVVVGPITAADFPHLHSLMSQYADHPMDFADATLVRLAQRDSISRIFTIDHSDFATYRIDGRRRFHIVPNAPL